MQGKLAVGIAALVWGLPGHATAAEVSPRARDHIAALEKALPACEQAAAVAEKALREFQDLKDANVVAAVDAVRLRLTAIRSLRTIIATDPNYFAWHLPASVLDQWQEALSFYLECARAGKDPFAGMTSGVRTCRSPIDGQLLFYVFKLPADYRPERRYPLDVALHSGAGLTWQAGWIDGKPSAEPGRASKEPRIWISPCGRGNNCYAGMGEVAVMDAIADVQRHYPVDTDRVTIGGASMGGTGGFRLATLHPDVFAAAHSLTGGPAYGVPVGNGRFDASLLVDNLCNTGMCIWDAPKEGHWKTNHAYAEGLRERAKAYPGFYPNLELTDPKGGHGIIDRRLQDEGREWIRQQERNRYPKRVIYKTYCLRYDGAYWTHIDTVDDPTAPARIEAELQHGNRMAVKVQNVDRFRLKLVPELVGKIEEVEVRVNEGPAFSAVAGGEVFFVRVDNRWNVAAARFPPGLVKKHGQSGPVQDVFMGEPVLMVYGTGERADAAAGEKRVDAAVLRLFGPGDGSHTLHTGFERKADRDVTAADIAARHLVLFGTPAQNSLVRKIADKLPARFLDDGVEIAGQAHRGEGVGLVMVYPNPLNPERYVLLLPEGYAGGSPWTYPDYLVTKTVSGPKGTSQQVLAQGTFDTRWAEPR